jgi:hypothetical protein
MAWTLAATLGLGCLAYLVLRHRAGRALAQLALAPAQALP